MGSETVSSAAQMEQRMDQLLNPVIPALEAQEENCSSAVENQGEPSQPIRISFTELNGPQVGLPTHTQMTARSSFAQDARISSGAQMDKCPWRDLTRAG